MTQPNPFFEPSPLPYRLPPFDAIEVAHYRPAFERGFAEQLAEIEAIATDPAPPTFANTVVALERSGRILDRVSSVFFSLTSSDLTDDIADIEAEIAPKVSAHRDALLLDDRIFARISAIDEELDAESARLLDRYQDDFRRAGADLSAADKTRLRELNAELAELRTTFGRKLLADSNDSAVGIDDVADLDGLTPAQIDAAAQSARSAGVGGYLLTLVLPTQQPLLASLTNPDVRARLLSAALARGSRGNDNDTTSLASRMATLRAQRARLLGFPTHAAYVIADRTAKTPEAVHAMLDRITPAAVANLRAEAEDLAEVAGRPITAADWTFSADTLRRQRYDIDSAALRPYFELDTVITDGVFYAANQLYGITVTERHDLPVYHPQVRVFEVFDADGSGLGLFLGDYYTRPSKNGGAWMTTFCDRSSLLGGRPVAVNNLNLVKPPDGQPTLCSIDEVRTLFHEFGHALHALFSAVTYPMFSGTSTPRDFVEYPSQVNEMWMLWPEVLDHYARHHQTGEPLPAGTAEKLRAAGAFNQGFKTTEYLAATLLDLAWHEISADDTIGDPVEFETAALTKAGLASDLAPTRYRTGYFKHIFAGGYSAGYYAYIWSEVLDADSVTWFTANGGLTRAGGDRFRREVLSRGGAVDPIEAFTAFRGAAPDIGPLLARRGLDAG